MSAPQRPHALEPQAPFIGHPLGGLVREDRFEVAELIDLPSGATERPRAAPASLDEDGFDFHLGAYARF